MPVDLTPLQRKTTGLGAAIRWKANRFIAGRLWLLNLIGARFTIFDAFGAPGDTLLAAIVCRHVKQRFPRIRLNVLTPNPELLRLDPSVNSINAPEDWFCFWQWYLDHVEHHDGASNVLEPTFRRLRIPDFEYRSRVLLGDDEVAEARGRVGEHTLPLLAFNTLSKEPVKNWSLESWLELIEKLRDRFDLLHLGDSREPVIPGVRRFAGSLDLRQSMALLAQARLHVGPDSFLMHAANGVGVPSVIIFGGSRTPENLGYKENANLFVKLPCGPCWIHESRGEHCAHGLECLKKITVADVLDAIVRLTGSATTR